ATPALPPLPLPTRRSSDLPKYGLGRHHPKTAAGHGRVAFLLLAIAKNGGITLDLLWRLIDIAEPMLQCRQHHIAHYIVVPEEFRSEEHPSGLQSRENIVCL